MRYIAAQSTIERQQNEIIDLQFKIINPIPDIKIDSRKSLEILTNPAGDDGVVHVILRDIHLTNRSNFPASIEMKFHFMLAGGTTLTQIRMIHR
jgi:hypothetical protein